MRAALLLVIASCLAAALGGCAGKGPLPSAGTPVAPGTAIVAGVVVDEAIRPVAGAVVSAADAAVNTTSDAKGEFSMALPVGAHVLVASHPSYTAVRQTVNVLETGVRGLVLQFTLTAAQGPYSTVQKYDGFVVCSLGISLIFSEECGEGVGTPVGRFGKQGNNAIRYDFQSESPSLKTIVVEQAWEPTSDAGREMLVLFNTNWTCEPACGGDAVGAGSVQGPSPLLLRVDEADLTTHLRDPATVFTTYTLARNDVTQVNVLLNQRFQLFVSLFYREPAPDGYSFVATGAA